MLIQAHFLTSYAAALLNRDDTGAAKRIVFGGKPRVRISSQCQKRAWRETLMGMDEANFPTGVRSTKVFENKVLPAVIAAGIPEERARQGLRYVLERVLKGAGHEKDALSLATNQPILVGNREVEFLAGIVAQELKKDGKPADLLAPIFKGAGPKATLAAVLGVDDPLAYGVESALFGRFVTSDVLARTDAAVSVSHAQTVHEAAVELDFFSVVDDLTDSSGAGHLGESEVNAGLFYGYVSIDVPGLVANLTGCNPKDWKTQDLSATRELIKTLLTVAATKSPGAKKGSTAPYAMSDFVLLEVGTEQPRQLANAFLKPVTAGEVGLMENSIKALSKHLGQLDGMYGANTQRVFATTAEGVEIPAAQRGTSLAAAIDQILATGTKA